MAKIQVQQESKQLEKKSKEDEGLTTNQTLKGLNGIQYEVHTWTSDVRGAGTDADVFIQLVGADKETGRLLLRDDNNNFEQGQKDQFTIEAPDVGEIRKIRIGHDGSNPMSGWHLSKVLVKRKSEVETKKTRKSANTKSKKSTEGLEEETDDYLFVVNRWFDTGEDDGAIERELILTDDKGIPTDDKGIPTDDKGMPTATDEKGNAISDLDNLGHSEPVNPIQTPADDSYISTQRSHNRNDPFYVASAYNKEPRDELENLRHYSTNQPESRLSGERPSGKAPSRKDTSLTNRPQIISPIQEEDTQAMLTIHTEDQGYYNNDFEENTSPFRESPSGISMYLTEQTTGAVGSIKRTLKLFD